MGLDGVVRCRCFEEGKLKPGPVPMEDLYIDEDGYLSSHILDDAYFRLGYESYYDQFGELDKKFHDWTQEPCEHEYGDYCSEWISNWAGVGAFCRRVREAGGEKKFPLLSALIPDGNGGIYPADKAQATLDELDRFIEVISQEREWVLVDITKIDDDIWINRPGATSVFIRNSVCEVGMHDGKVYIENPGKGRIETSYFKQTPTGRHGISTFSEVKITCLDTGEIAYVNMPLDDDEFQNKERTFTVLNKEASFLYEGKYLTAERIRNLLQASIETGNPIQWC